MTPLLRIFNLSGAAPTANGDGSSATFATLAAVCRAGATVTYAFPSARGAELDESFCAELRSACAGRVTFLPLEHRGNQLDTLVAWAAIARNAASAGLWALRLARSRSVLGKRDLRLRTVFTVIDRTSFLAKALRSAARNAPYDVAQVDFPWMAGLGARLGELLPSVYVCYELQSEIVEQSAPSMRWLRDRLRRSESATMRRFDRVLALSPEDAEYIETVLGVPRVESSPLAIDVAAKCAATPRDAGAAAARFTFLGSSGHPPNLHAVRWLRESIVPRLRLEVPGAELSIVGRYSPDFVRENAQDGLRFEGFVEDLAPALRNSILLCPIRQASGMRIKILDGILRGATVVSTRLGLSGLPFRPEEEVLMADSPEEFVRQCRRLVDDDAQRLRLSVAAQKKLLSHFSPEAIAALRLRILSDVASRARPRRSR